MGSVSKTKKSSSSAGAPGAYSSKKVLDKAPSSSKNGAPSKSKSKSLCNSKKNGSRDERGLSLTAPSSLKKESSDVRNKDVLGMDMTPSILTAMKRREERDRIVVLPQRSEEDAEVDAATSTGSAAQHCSGGVKTTIGTGKFRASPIMKNPKAQAQDGPGPHGKDQGEGADGSHNKESSHLDGAEFHPHDDRARNNGAAVSADRARYAEYDRWERDPYYGEGGYGRWPAPRPRKADGDERDLLDAEGGERGPNVISPNRPPYPPNHPGYNRYYGERSEAERPASAARTSTREREASAPIPRIRERDHYYEDDRPGAYDYPPTPSRRYPDPYAYEHGPYSPSRSYGAEGSSASMYQYSPVRTKSKDFDRESESPRDFMESFAKSPDATPVRKESEALEGSPAWRPRHSDYPSHSPPRVAWDVAAISTPREGPPPPPHYSPDPSGFGYLASPREGWGPSPYRGPPIYSARAGDAEGLKWMDSPGGSLMQSPKKPVRPMFREKPKEEQETLLVDEPVDKRSLPTTYPLPQNTWSFGEGFGGSFDEHDIPKSPYGTSGRLPPQPPTRNVPPPPPDVDPYWNDYYAGGGYGPPPGEFGHLYSPRRAWTSSGGRMPPPTDHSRVSLPPSHSLTTPMASTSSASRDRRDPQSANKKSRKSSGPSVPLPVAVTPTSSQSVALQQFGDAVVYSRNRLGELLMLSSPAKSGSAQTQDIPPWETLPPALEKLLDAVTSHDVLLGRGGGTNTQAGNKRFRAIVNAHQPMYLEARRKEKPLIARCIVEWIRLKGGRFLKKDDVSGKWHEVGDERAEAKTSQALREGLDVREKKSGMSSCGGSVGSSGAAPTAGSARKRKKEKSLSSDRHHGDHSAYDHHHAAWGDYAPPPHSHYYGRPSFYDASRRIRGRDDYGHAPPPHAHHSYYHHHGVYGQPPAYAPPQIDYQSPSKRIKWTDSSRSDNAGYPNVPNVLSEDHDRERQYYKEFNPPPSSKSGKLPMVAPSYDQGDGL